MGAGRLQPHPYQQEAIEFLSGANRHCGDDCGLGKTLIAIEVGARFKGPKLIVCNSKAKSQWFNAILQQQPSAKISMASIGGMNSVNWTDMIANRPDMWYIIHWEGVVRQVLVLHKVLWDLVILDEAHKIRNRGIQRARACKVLQASHKITLSATDMEKDPRDFWSIFNFLDPKAFPSYHKFCDNFFILVGKGWGGSHYMGIYESRKEEFAKLLSTYIIRRTKLQVAPQLPPKIFTTVPIELSAAERVWYNKIAKQTIVEITPADFDIGVYEPTELFVNGALARTVRLHQAALDCALLGMPGAPSSKRDWILEWLEDNPDEVVVILSVYREFAIELSKHLKCALVVGSSSSKGLDRWLDGEERVLVGTIASVGESLNLQRAGTLIFANQHRSATTMAQAIDRVHRINITEPKNIITLQAQHTIDVHIAKALTKKWGEREALYDLLKQWNDYN